MKNFDRLELALFLAVPLSGLALVACGGSRGAEPEEIQDALDEVVVPIVDDTSAAMQFLDDSSVLQDLDLGGSGMSRLFGGSAGQDVAEPEPEVVDPNEPTAGEQMSRFLREVIFTEDNYEGDGVYRIRGRDVCNQGDTVAPVDGEGAPEPDADADNDCEQMVDDMQLRIQVMLVDGGFDATLLVGPHRAKPLKLESRDDRITVVANLGAAKAAIEHIASVTGAEVELPDVLEGVFAATVRRDGDSAATLSLAVREDVWVQVGTEDGDVSVEVAAAEPLARLSLDAIARHLEAEANAGPISASLPWTLLESDSEGSAIRGTLHVDIAGATGTAVLDDDEESVVLTGLGLGDSTSRVTLDDQVLWSMDVNADHGRTFDLTVTPADGGATLVVDPALQVAVTMDMRPVTESGDTVDPAQDGDTYELVFDGESPTAQVIEGDETQDGALRIVSGHLHMAATGVPSIDVDAGQCLLSSDAEDGDGSALAGLSSGTCP